MLTNVLVFICLVTKRLMRRRMILEECMYYKICLSILGIASFVEFAIVIVVVVVLVLVVMAVVVVVEVVVEVVVIVVVIVAVIVATILVV